jgi:hypothetical protein
MKIYEVSNPFFPNKKTYRCDIGHHSIVGDYDEVSEWRNDRLENSDYYKALEELRSNATAEFLSKDKGNKGD